MSSIEKIKTFKDSCEQFFLKFTKNFEPKMPFEQFHKFRLYFINILYEVIYNILHFFIGPFRFFRNSRKIAYGNKHFSNRLLNMGRNNL